MLHLQESNFYAMHNLESEKFALSGIQKIIKKEKVSFIELSYEQLENFILAYSKTANEKKINGKVFFLPFF